MTFPAYPANKESGVEWLGEVPEHWSITPLKFSASCNDTVLPDSTDDDYEIEYVEISDVNEISGITGCTSYKFSDAPSRARRMLQDGDVLISTVRTYLRAIAPVVSPPENLIASTGFAVIRPRKGILDGAFLGYLLRAEWWISEVIARSVGVSYPAINASDLIGLNVPVPAWHEQIQIARFLDHETARIDALIEEQQRLIELLKEKRQAVISHAVTKGLDPTVPMKDSDVEWLGEVPAHWEVKKLKHFGRVTGGFAFKSTEFTSEGHPVLKISNIGHLCFEWGDQSYLPDEFRESHSEFIAPKGALVFAMTRPVIAGGIKVARLEDDSLPLVNQRVGFMVVHDVDLSRYLLLSTQSDPFLNQFKNNLTITNQPNISSEGIESISIAVPPLIDMKNILAFCQKFDAAVQGLIGDALRGTELLQERRSALISAAVTGKIDVRGWQPPASASSPELAQEAL